MTRGSGAVISPGETESQEAFFAPACCTFHS